MPDSATSVLRGNLLAFLVASAIALLPTHVLKTAVVAAIRYAAALKSSAGPVARQPEERQNRLRDEVGTSGTSGTTGTSATSRTGETDGTGGVSQSPSAGTRTERALSAIRDLPELPARETVLLDGILICAVLPLLAFGVYLALSALTPMVAACREGTRCSASQAWELVGARFGALLGTAALAAILTLVGLLFLVLPGVALALGFTFALPSVLVEGQSGIGALNRSLALAVRVMPRLIGIALLFPLLRLAAVVAATLLLPHGALVPRLLLADAVSILLFPLPIAALALLFEEARRMSPPHVAQSPMD
jgi:hypothetical protein